MALATMRDDDAVAPQSGVAARHAIRRNAHAGPTSGLAGGGMFPPGLGDKVGNQHARSNRSAPWRWPRCETMTP